jgi:hypothetical protein
VKLFSSQEGLSYMEIVQMETAACYGKTTTHGLLSVTRSVNNMHIAANGVYVKR